MKKLFLFFLLLSSNGLLFAAINSPLEISKQVLQKLYQTNGNFIHLKPNIKITSDVEKVAAYYPRQNLIIIEEKAYNICQSFGADAQSALAFIIGHELAHAFEKSHETNYLAFDHAIEGDKKAEYNADIFGLFNAYLANFKSIDILPELIDRIYDEYKLKNKKLTSYPSLEERQYTARTVVEAVNRLIQVYEGANYLAAIGQYDLAAASFEYIASHYQGREVYNNLGVNYALHAINFTDKDVDVFLYPLELDWESRIKKPKTDRGDKDLSPEQMQYRRMFLLKAKKYLEKASLMDPKYFISDLNMVCVLSLLGNYQQAIDYYSLNNLELKAQWSSASSQTKANAKSALAIAYAKQKTQSSLQEARKIWEQLKDNNSPLVTYQAKYNLKMLSQKPCSPLKSYDNPPPINLDTTTDNIRLHHVNYSNAFLLNKSKKISLAIQVKQNSIVYHYSTPINKFTLQRITSTSMKNQKINNFDEDKLSLAVPLNKGYFDVYSKEKGIIFFNEKGQILEWAKFHYSK